jgi:hypothetical protein
MQLFTILLLVIVTLLGPETGENRKYQGENSHLINPLIKISKDYNPWVDIHETFLVKFVRFL